MVVCWHLPRETEEYHKNQSEQLISQLAYTSENMLYEIAKEYKHMLTQEICSFR
jgi:hypothetical protein